MRKFLIVLFKLMLGFFFFALSTVMIINCKIGVSPWDVLNQGVGNVTNISIGRASIYIGFIILAFDIALGQNIGWATVLNMIIIGSFVDIIIALDIIPVFNTGWERVLMIFLGMVAQGLGAYFYISPGYGTGPRDGLTVALSKLTKKSFGFIKTTLEVGAVAVGYMLGGNFGIGTLVLAFVAGYLWQYMHKKMGFSISDVEHRYIQDDIKWLSNRFKKAETP